MKFKFKGILVWGNKIPKRLISSMDELEDYANFTIMFENEHGETKDITVKIPKEFTGIKKDIISSIILCIDKNLGKDVETKENEGEEKVEEGVWK